MSEPDPDLDEASDEALVVVVSDEAVAAKRRRAPRPQPTTRLSLTVPAEVAHALADALAILPGADLDQLACRALQQVVQMLTPAGAARPPRRRYDSGLIVLL